MKKFLNKSHGSLLCFRGIALAVMSVLLFWFFLIPVHGEEDGNTKVKYIYHEHEGRSSLAGGCYNTPVYHEHLGNSQEGGTCYEIPVYHTHSGDEIVGGGCFGEAVYHTHVGSSGDGCYTKVIYHSHNDSCYRYGVIHNCDVVSYYYDGDRGMVWNYSCGATVTGSSGDGYHGTCTMGDVLICNDGGRAEGWDLDCGKTTETVEAYVRNCRHEEGDLEGYALSCAKTASDIDYYDCDCGLSEDMAYGALILSVPDDSLSETVKLVAEFVDYSGGLLEPDDNAYLWMDENGTILGNGSEMDVSSNGLYSVQVCLRPNPINNGSLTQEIGVRNVKPPVSLQGDGSNQGEYGETSEGESSNSDSLGKEGEEKPVNSASTPTPSPKPTAIKKEETALPPYSPEKGKSSGQGQSGEHTNEDTDKLRDGMGVSDLLRKGNPTPMRPLISDIRESEEETVTMEIMGAANQEQAQLAQKSRLKQFFGKPVVRVISITLGSIIPVGFLLLLLLLLLKTVIICCDNGEGKFFPIGIRTVKKNENGYFLILDEKLLLRAQTNHYRIYAVMFSLGKREDTQMLILRENKRKNVTIRALMEIDI